LSFSISLQRMKLVAGIEHQRFKTWCGMKNHKPFSCLSFKRLKSVVFSNFEHQYLKSVQIIDIIKISGRARVG
jgi:hypothetical protein